MYLSGFGHSPYYRIFNEMRILCFQLDVGLLIWILFLSCEIRYKFNIMRGWQSLLCYGVLYLCPSHPRSTGTHIVTAKSTIKPQQIIFPSEMLVCQSVRACLLKFYILSCMVNETVPPWKTTAWDISANAPKTTYVWQSLLATVINTSRLMLLKGNYVHRGSMSGYKHRTVSCFQPTRLLDVEYVLN